MKFTPPLKQYLFRWFREGKIESENPLGGVIIEIVDDPTNKLKFIHTSMYSKGYNTGKWKTHETDGSVRHTYLKEYRPTKEEQRHALRTVFVLSNEDGTIE